MDGCGAHITWEFMDYCNTNKIKLVLLPAHATHFLQPLDVGIFQPFKHWHAEGVDKAMRLGAEDFNKLDFLDLFPRIYTETFRSSTIQGAWRATRLVPYEPEIILRHLREQQVQRLTTPPPPEIIE